MNDRSPMPLLLKRWLPFALFLALCIGIIAGADRGGLRAFLNLVASVPFLDKVGHVALIGSLAYLFNRALGGRRLGPFQLGGLIVAACMTAEEFSQLWFPTRTFDLLDLTANYTGVACAEIAWRVRSSG